METYGEITLLQKFFKDLKEILSIKKGYIPLGMTLNLAEDLRKKGFTEEH